MLGSGHQEWMENRKVKAQRASKRVRSKPAKRPQPSGGGGRTGGGSRSYDPTLGF